MGRRMYSIGEFARLCGLSVKTLRLYHARGLLEPAAVDSWTGYRAYDDRSLERARLVTRLRDLDVPLVDIADLVAGGDGGGLAGLLVRQRAVIETRLRRLRRALLSVETELVERKEDRMNDRFQLDRDVDARVRARQTRGDGPKVPSIVLASAGGEAGGEALAAVLGQRIGFEAWDRALVDAVASDPGRRAAVLGALDDEQRRAAEAAAGTLAPGAGEPIRHLLGVAAALGVQGRTILLDVAAHRLLPVTGALRVRLEAPLDKAIPHVAARRGLELEAARRFVEERAAASVALEREAFGDAGASSGDAIGAYDLIMNSSTLDLFSAVELVVAAFESKFHPDPGWWCPA